MPTEPPSMMVKVLFTLFKTLTDIGILALVTVVVFLSYNTFQIYHQAQSSRPYVNLTVPLFDDPSWKWHYESLIYRRIYLGPIDVVLKYQLVHFERLEGTDPIFAQPLTDCKFEHGIYIGEVLHANSTHITVHTLSPECKTEQIILDRYTKKIWKLSRTLVFRPLALDLDLVESIGEFFALGQLYPDIERPSNHFIFDFIHLIYAPD